MESDGVVNVCRRLSRSVGGWSAAHDAGTFRGDRGGSAGRTSAPVASTLPSVVTTSTALCELRCPHNETKPKQNRFETVLKLFRFNFNSLCGQF